MTSKNEDFKTFLFATRSFPNGSSHLISVCRKLAICRTEEGMFSQERNSLRCQSVIYNLIRSVVNKIILLLSVRFINENC